MTEDVISLSTVVAAVGSALVAGVMLAFSTSVMPGLGRRPASQAAAAMQAMNAAILNPVFGLAFGGTLLVCVALAVTAPFTGDHGDAGWRALGALLYVVGTFGVTMAVNVPLNEALDEVDPESPAGSEMWGRFRTRWTAWNNLRTVAGAAGAVALIASL
jgi:uncharacterized membrane protein